MKNNQSPWTILNSKTAYQNKWYQVVENQVIRPDGEEGLYAVVETPPAVFIVALTTEKEVYLINLFRFTSQQFSWELPAGGSENKPLLEAAQKELQEETGLTAKNWQKIGSFFPLNGIANEETHVFLATILTQTKDNEQREEGIIEIKTVPFKKALEMIRSGEITDGQTIAALMQAQLYLQNQ